MKNENRAKGHFWQYQRAEKAGNKEGMADQRNKIHALGYDIKNGALVKKAKSATKAASKPATKKAAEKKPAAKKAAAKAADDNIKQANESGASETKTTTKPAASGTTKGKTMKRTKKQMQAQGHYSALKKAEKAGDQAAAAAQREKIHALGFSITKDGLAKKATTKKAAAKKPAAKKAAAKKPAAKKAAPKKAAAKGGRKTSKKGPAFPAAGKGGKVQSKTAQTTYKKGGRTYTKTVTRTFRQNPMGKVGEMLTLLLFGTIGAIGGDMLDRWIAIMPEKKEGQTGDVPLLSGSAAAVAIGRKPDGKRMAAQGALFTLLAAVAWYLNKKNKQTASFVIGAMALGVGIRALLQIVNGHVVPAVLPSSKDASKPSFGDHIYPEFQEAAQADLNKTLESYLHGELTAAPAAAAPGRGATLAGIAERAGSTVPTAQVSDRRPAAIVPSNQVARELTRPVAPAARVGAPQNTAALTQGASSSLAREVTQPSKGKLGCGGPSCGPACDCDACKADFGNNPLSALLNPRPPVSAPALPPRQGATAVPTPASDNRVGAPLLPFAPKRVAAARGAVPHLRAL